MKVSNWNGRPEVENARVISFKQGDVPKDVHTPRGNGRSYGDASLQDTIINCSEHKKTIELTNGILTVSAGFTVRDILNFCLPKGYILAWIVETVSYFFFFF